MFSQNVFSAKDVLANSSHCDNNTWDSQQYGQVNSYSQNSQPSSIELFSQHKSSDLHSRFDPQYQRSQSQTTEDEPSNYYSKYVKNPPLFNGSTSNNQKLTQSIKDMIEEQKRSVSIREERDLLQTFINLLKDYTKEVNSSFENFKDYMTKSFQEITKSQSEEFKSYDNNFQKLKEELLSNIEKTDKESNEKKEMKINLLEQTGTINVLESKVEILEKQLNEAKEKESAYADQKTRYHELEDKYLQGVTNWEFGQGSFLGNTPPLSQQTDPLCTFLMPPLGHVEQVLENPAPGNYNLLSSQVPLMSSSYGLNYWETGNPKSADTIDYYNPQIINSIQMDSRYNPAMYQETSNMIPAATSCPYSSLGTSADVRATSHLSRNSVNYTQQQEKTIKPNQTLARNNHSCQYNHFNTSGPIAQKPSGLVVSRRSSKRPKQSPMAMVRPQVRRNDSQDSDDDIFLCGIKRPHEDHQKKDNTKTTINSKTHMGDREWKSREGKSRNRSGLELGMVSRPVKQQVFHERLRSSKAIENQGLTKNTASHKGIPREKTPTKYAVPQETNNEEKGFRQEESVRRKRSLVSMLGTSSDDLEMQEITNSIKAQQRLLVKRIKSLS